MTRQMPLNGMEGVFSKCLPGKDSYKGQRLILELNLQQMGVKLYLGQVLYWLGFVILGLTNKRWLYIQLESIRPR